MNSFWIGILTVLAAAVMQGSWALPQKFVKGWAWEKMWLFYSLSAMILFPWLLVALVIPGPLNVYSQVGSGMLFQTLAFGAGWGLGSVLFGLAIARVGLALGFAIIISLTAVLGSLVPMLALHPAELASHRGQMLMIGLAIVIAGVVLCSRAGALKDAAGAGAGGGKFLGGLLLCIASGITSPMFNIGYEMGKPIATTATSNGADPNNASIAIFAVLVFAGFFINAGYCLYLLSKNKSWGQGGGESMGRNLACSILMGFLWLFGFFLYGVGSTQMGANGASIGWALLMTTMVLVANLWGVLTGEWKKAGQKAVLHLAAGLAVMVAAILFISFNAQ